MSAVQPIPVAVAAQVASSDPFDVTAAAVLPVEEETKAAAYCELSARRRWMTSSDVGSGLSEEENLVLAGTVGMPRNSKGDPLKAAAGDRQHRREAPTEGA
jgi:hypothetical protein